MTVSSSKYYKFQKGKIRRDKKILTYFLLFTLQAGILAEKLKMDGSGVNLSDRNNVDEDNKVFLKETDYIGSYETENDLNYTTTEDILAIYTKDNNSTSIIEDQENAKIHKKCDILVNGTYSDEIDNMPSKILDSIYLNNIHSSVTTNLIAEQVSVDDIETNGVNLYEMVNSDCGGTKKCPDLSRNWTIENTIAIGFLGAYGRSQVRMMLSINLYLKI